MSSVLNKVTGKGSSRGKYERLPSESRTPSKSSEHQPPLTQPSSSQAASEGSRNTVPKKPTSSLLNKYPQSKVDDLLKPVDSITGADDLGLSSNVTFLETRLRATITHNNKLKDHQAALKREIGILKHASTQAQDYKSELKTTEKNIATLETSVKNLEKRISSTTKKVRKSAKKMSDDEREWLASYPT
jgi:hypothetical protein